MARTSLPAAASARAQRGIGYIPQGRDIFPRLTVEENLTIGEMIGRATAAASCYELVYRYFPILPSAGASAAGTMSGGQQQQLAIGRALIGNPDLLLLDEPSEGIQPSIVQEIAGIMLTLNEEIGTTMLFVEQNIDMIMSMAQRCYVMDKGAIVDQAGPRAIWPTRRS